MNITVSTNIHAPLSRVWNCWTQPEHIIQWNFASDEWCCPSAVNHPVAGEHFSWRMEARDGSMGFDYSGTYLEVEKEKRLHLRLDDDRLVEINFAAENDAVMLSETFETEDENEAELQRQGWQAILNNFKSYVESLG